MKLGGVGSVSLVFLAALACGGNSKSGAPEATGGSGGSPNGSGASAVDGGNGDSGEAGDSGESPAGTGGAGTAGAPSRGGAGGTPNTSRGGTGEAGAPDAPPSRGGSSSSGGAGGEQPEIAPDGCSVLSQYSSGDTCDLTLRCDDGDYMTIHCVDMMIDVWQCGCNGGSMPPNYNLGNVSELAACQAMAQLCRSETPPNPVGPVECGTPLEDRTAYSCQLRQACFQQIDGNASATLATLDETYCDDDGTGRLACSCSNSGWSFYPEGPDGTTACDLISEFCEEPVEPDFETADWDCMSQFESSSSGGCEVHSSCRRAAIVADGVTVPQNSWADVKCQNDEVNGSTCTCNGPPGEFRIESDESVSGVDFCSDLTTLCVELGEVEFSGDASCTNTSLTTDVGSCEAELRCGATATVSGKRVTTLRPVSVSCTQTDGSWLCNCNTESASTTVPAEGSTPWDVCTNASDLCANAVTDP